jgi:DNA-binding MarR family transcriptional regulator
MRKAGYFPRHRGRAPMPTHPTGSQRGISLLFDVFVLNQRLRSLLAVALVDAGLKADEYAVYSLLFEVGPITPTEMARQMAMPLTTVLDYVRSLSDRGHVRRRAHARDGRSHQLQLTRSGLAAFHKANAAWNAGIAELEPALEVPAGEVRRALHALDDAAAEAHRRLVEAAIGKAG